MAYLFEIGRRNWKVLLFRADSELTERGHLRLMLLTVTSEFPHPRVCTYRRSHIQIVTPKSDKPTLIRLYRNSPYQSKVAAVLDAMIAGEKESAARIREVEKRRRRIV